MTRGELVAELLSVWEESAQNLIRSGLLRAAGNVRTAISVLETTYTAAEMGVGVDLAYEEKHD